MQETVASLELHPVRHIAVAQREERLEVLVHHRRLLDRGHDHVVHLLLRRNALRARLHLLQTSHEAEPRRSAPSRSGKGGGRPSRAGPRAATRWMVGQRRAPTTDQLCLMPTAASGIKLLSPPVLHTRLVAGSDIETTPPDHAARTESAPEQRHLGTQRRSASRPSLPSGSDPLCAAGG